jgi:hypothetical protein
MSNFDIPINYSRDVIMRHDNQLLDDSTYIEEKNKIVNEKREKKKTFYEDSIINPNFTPDEFIKQQTHIKETNKIETDEFHPYLNYLESKGLLNKNPQVRYNIDYINVDSANRNKEPYNIPKKLYQLDNNCLDITDNYLNIHINKTQISDFTIGDKISLTNILPLEKTYNCYDTSYNQVIYFESGKSYATIKINPNVNILYNESINTSTLDLYKYYDTTNVYVKISGVIGTSSYQIQNFFSSTNTISEMYKNDENSAFIGNIPVAFINDNHRIYLLPPDGTIATPDKNIFYIKLPYAATGSKIGNIITPNVISELTNTPQYLIDPYQISFTFNHYNLIPLNQLNADFPVTNNNIHGYHIINSIDDDYIKIKIYPNINLDLIDKYNFGYNRFGGNNINLNLINKINYGYPSQNNYSINLEKIYTNIVEIKIIDSLFKNPIITIINNGNSKNNMLYFQSIENIEAIQSIEIPQGYYTAEKLKLTLEHLFSNTSRISNFYNYDSNYNIIVDIDEATNLVSFTNYKKARLKQAIRNISPVINITDNMIGDGVYTITITHENHGIFTQTKDVIFSGFIDDTGILGSDLNGKKTITILDTNTYQFTLNNINLTQIKTITHGGNGITILVPSEIKFYFNYEDTAADVLGFRNGGIESSITSFNTIIKNSDPYQNEQPYDFNGNKITIKNNSIKLKKYLYFLMTCKEISQNNIINVNNKQNAFAKFKISDDNILNNEFTSTPIFFYNPLTQLDKLSFQFYNPDNTLIDFNNEEHSFILQITTIDNIPELTGLNSTMSTRR